MRQLSLFLFCAFLGWPLTTAAALIFSDGFESPLVASGWNTESCASTGVPGPWPDGCGNPARVTGRAHSGAYSLRATYSPGCGQDLSGHPCGSSISRRHIGTTAPWTRFWTYAENFAYHPTATRRFSHFPTTRGAASFVLDHFRSVAVPTWELQAGWDLTPPCAPVPGSCTYLPNQTLVGLGNDKWSCVETHVQMNTSGKADGIAEVWVDGTLVTRVTNRRFSHEPYDPAMTLFQLSVQDGRQLDTTRDAYIYYDDLVLGDSRIGCAPPPPAPTGLTIK